MKRMWIVLFATLATSCFGQEHYLYGKTYALSNFYLHDNTNVALHLRVPTGEVARVDAGIFQPDGAIAFRGGAISLRGPVQLFTNQFTLTYVSNGVSEEETGVCIRANGEIVLNRFIPGMGWSNVVINPTNILPYSMLPMATLDSQTNYVRRDGDTMTGPLAVIGNYGLPGQLTIYSNSSWGSPGGKVTIMVQDGVISVLAYVAGVPATLNVTTNGWGATPFRSSAFTGNGVSITNISAENIAAGGTLPALDGNALTNGPWWIFTHYAPSNSSATATNKTIAAAGGDLYICETNSWGGLGTNWLKFTGAAF